MIKRIRLLTVTFDSQIKPYEVPAFRGAIIDKVGQRHVLFHHHMGDGYLYKYPSIQYKAINHKPAIVCIDQGVDEIHHYFEKPDWSLWLGDRKLEMKVDKLHLNQFILQVWNCMFEYKIHNWIALSQENYARYKNLEAETERIEMLERILKGNILAFAKGVEWMVEKPIELKITSSPVSHPVSLKGQKVLGFNLTFKTNVFLPNYIGLGKSVSIGYGMVKQLHKKEKENN
ncbi:MAG: CRISPR-associated endonuclease Cas6 [Bacteroidales bacterium]|nr:CRISPR-associated endonuclease Cas6 [Bacteroidales bacterium]